MATVKKAKKAAKKRSPKKARKAVKKAKKAATLERVRLLEAEILAQRLKDYKGAPSDAAAAYLPSHMAAYLPSHMAAYLPSHMAAYLPSHMATAPGADVESPVTIQVLPEGNISIQTDFNRSRPLTIQINPGGQIDIKTG